MLKSLKVIELEGYLPLSFLGKLLLDLGAEVYLVSSTKENEVMKPLIHLHEGKKKTKLNLKNKEETSILKKMIHSADILIEGYRPGVLEKFGLNPLELTKENQALIILRMTGYGQVGLYKDSPGHEINYMSLSGILENFQNEDRIVNPMIIIGDLFCGSLMPLFQLSQAILNRKLNGGLGCIIDSAITTNLITLSTFATKTKSFLDDNIHISILTKDNHYILISTKHDDSFQELYKKINQEVKTSLDKFDQIKEIKEKFLNYNRDEIYSLLEDTKNLSILPIVKLSELPEFLRDAKVIDSKGNIIDVFAIKKLNFNNRNKAIHDSALTDFANKEMNNNSYSKKIKAKF